MTSRKISAFSRWSVLTLGLLLQLTLGATAQESADESTVAPATQVTFNFVQTPDVSSIGSLAADSENDIWATSVLKPVALHFDGSQWKKVPMVNASRINKVIVLSSTNVWAVGQQPNPAFSQIQHFNGTKWTVVPSPHFTSGETLNSLKAISANNIFAVGSSLASPGSRTPLVEHFNGTTWSVVPVPRITGGALSDIAIISPSDIWAVGGTDNSVATLHFDGNKWSQVPAPGASAGLFGVTALSTNNVWAVGARVGTGALIEHWNGTAWKIVSNPSAIGTLLNNVSAISPTDIWAVGCNACGDVGGLPPLVEHWDGRQWNINSAPIEGGGLSANAVLTFPSRHIYVGGFIFNTFGPTSFLLKGAEGQ